MTTYKYLLGLKDRDAEQVAVAIRADFGDCPIDSGCGVDMKKAIDAAKAMTASMDAAGVFTEEQRWEVWFNAQQCCEVFYKG